MQALNDILPLAKQLGSYNTSISSTCTSTNGPVPKPRGAVSKVSQASNTHQPASDEYDTAPQLFLLYAF